MSTATGADNDGYFLPPHEIKYGVMVPLGELHVDPTVQRTLDLKRATKMADDFKSAAVGTIVVSQRKNGDKYIVDGMHRHKACELDGTMPEVACEIHYGLALADEAQLFLIKNRESKGIGAFDLYKVGVSAGISEFVDTSEVLKRHHLEISGSSSTNKVGAAGGFPRVVQIYGPEYLDRALTVLTAAFGRDQYTWEGNLVHGTARVIHDYGDKKITDLELIGKLKAQHLDAETVVTKINSRARSGVGSSGSGSRRLAGFYVILDMANARRRKSNWFGPPSYLNGKNRDINEDRGVIVDPNEDADEA